MASDPNLELLKLLLREERLDVATLQALRGVPNLDAALVQRGLLSSAEVGEYVAALRRGQAHGLGQVGDYQLLSRLGQGGMGAVYEGQHVSTGARHAIKVATALTAEALERFRREGQAQAQVDSHPNVLRVYGAGVSGNKHYLIMDLATGGDLSVRLDQGPLPPLEAAEMVAQLADGLQHVHDRGILHRDLKPANVLFDAGGAPLLVDFGLARVLDAQTLTRSHALLGTPAYMAPEQVRGQQDAVDARSDVYGLGTVLYESLTGRYLFESAVGLQVLAHVIDSAPTPPRKVQPTIPPWLESVCLKALAKAQHDRFPTAAAFAAALRARQPVARASSSAGPLIALLLLLLGVLTLGAGATAIALWPRELAPEPVSGIAQIATELFAGLHSPRPLRDDLPRIEDLRRRLLAEAPQTAAHELAVAQADCDLWVWEGLVALARDDTPQARAHLRRARSAEARLRRKLEGYQTPAWTAVLTAALESEREPRAAIAALEAALPAFDRPELHRWLDTARLHACYGALLQNEVKTALADLRAVQDRAAAPELLAKLQAHCAREIGIVLRELPSIPPGKKSNHKARGYFFADMLALAGALTPGGGVSDADFEALLAFSTDPGRYIFTLGPALAALRPDDFEVQRRVANHHLVLDRGVRTNRRDLALRYLAATQRAYELAPNAKLRGEVGTKLCDLMRQAQRTTQSRELCTELLRDDGLSEDLRARVLSTRGEVLRLSNQLKPALADFKASCQLRDAPMTHHRRGLTLWALGSKHSVSALRAFLACVRGINPRGSISKDEGAAYRLSVLGLWRGAIRLEARYGLAIQGLDSLLSYYDLPRYAGWFLRRAYLQLSCRPPRVEAAVADVRRAIALLPQSRGLEDLLPEARRTLAAVRAEGAEARTQVWDLLQPIGKRTEPGDLLHRLAEADDEAPPK